MADWPAHGVSPWDPNLKAYIDDADLEATANAETTAQTALDDHIADTTGAHAASAISYAGSSSLTDANVEAALDTLSGRALRAMLTATESNSTLTPAVLTGHTFTIPPGLTLRLTGLMIFRTAATTTGAAYGVRVTQPSGASGNAQGSVALDVAISASAVATGLRLGDNFDVAANSNALVEIVGTDVSSTSADHVAQCVAIIKNTAAAHSTTVTVEFRSEVNSSAVTAQIGTAAAGVLG
jgi:hypothetical protein